MDDDVIRPGFLGMPGEIEDDIEVLVRAGHHGLRPSPDGLDGELQAPLPLVEAHREELPLLPRDEEPCNVQILGPMTDVRTESVFVQPQIGRERHQSRGPDPFQMGLGIGLRVTSGVLHVVLRSPCD